MDFASSGAVLLSRSKGGLRSAVQLPRSVADLQPAARGVSHLCLCGGVSGALLYGRAGFRGQPKLVWRRGGAAAAEGRGECDGGGRCCEEGAACATVRGRVASARLVLDDEV